MLKSSSFTCSFETPVGVLSLWITNGKLISLNILSNKTQTNMPSDEVSLHLKNQLLNYFQNSRHKFDIEISLIGTKFQLKVWEELVKINIGQTISYGELAKKINSHPRAVAQACKRNPIPIIIPCHRVVAKQGLGGYNGATDGAMIDLKI